MPHGLGETARRGPVWVGIGSIDFTIVTILTGMGPCEEPQAAYMHEYTNIVHILLNVPGIYCIFTECAV